MITPLDNGSDPVVRLDMDDFTSEALSEKIRAGIGSCWFDPDADTTILAKIGLYALSATLSGQVLTALRRFRSNDKVALVIDNLPSQLFPATPTGGFTDENEMAFINALQFGLIDLMGLCPFAVRYENRGRLIRNVAPNPEAAGTTSSWGADTEFFWHTDNPHLTFLTRGTDPRLAPPRYLTFIPARNIEQVPTSLTPALDPEVRDVLASPSFDIAAAASVDIGLVGCRLRLTGAPLIEAVGQTNWVRYDRGTVTARTEEATDALAVFTQALEAATAVNLVLDRGQFLIFDNYRVLHRREAFTPAKHGNARWLRRCYAS